MFKSEKTIIEIYDDESELKRHRLKCIQKLQTLKACTSSEERFLKVCHLAFEVFKSVNTDIDGEFRQINSANLEIETADRILKALMSKQVKLSFLEMFTKVLLVEKKEVDKSDWSAILAFLRCLKLRQYSVLETSNSLPLFLKKIYQALKEMKK